MNENPPVTRSRAPVPPEEGKGASCDEVETASIGAYLAQQRSLRGISVDELVERTRIPRRNIELLEAGAFDTSPDGFARGFVRTLAAALGLDPEEAVMRLMREPPDGFEEVSPRRLPRPRTLLRMGLAAAVALVVVLSWALWPASDPSPALVEADGSGWVYRHDAVRDLAEDQASSERLEPRAPEWSADDAGATPAPVARALPSAGRR